LNPESETRVLTAHESGERATRALFAIGVVWFAASVAVLAIAGAERVVVYLLLFVGVYGGVLWSVRHRIRPGLARLGLDNTAGFVLLGVGASSIEETVSFAAAGPSSLVIPNLPVDLVWINAIWLGWLLPWYVFIPRRFSFTEREALLVGGSTGVLFEVIVTRIAFSFPLVVLWVPVAWTVYAVVFLAPLQLVRFPTSSSRRGKVPVALAATWGPAIAVALALYVLFGALGLPR